MPHHHRVKSPHISINRIRTWYCRSLHKQMIASPVIKESEVLLFSRSCSSVLGQEEIRHYTDNINLYKLI